MGLKIRFSVFAVAFSTACNAGKALLYTIYSAISLFDDVFFSISPSLLAEFLGCKSMSIEINMSNLCRIIFGGMQKLTRVLINFSFIQSVLFFSDSNDFL